MEAEYGEILTTCEKIRYIIRYGEDALKCLHLLTSALWTLELTSAVVNKRNESRGVPLLLFLKKAWVEYYPMGVIGIIVPWVRLLGETLFL